MLNYFLVTSINLISAANLNRAPQSKTPEREKQRQSQKERVLYIASVLVLLKLKIDSSTNLNDYMIVTKLV